MKQFELQQLDIPCYAVSRMQLNNVPKNAYLAVKTSDRTQEICKLPHGNGVNVNFSEMFASIKQRLISGHELDPAQQILARINQLTAETDLDTVTWRWLWGSNAQPCRGYTFVIVLKAETVDAKYL